MSDNNSDTECATTPESRRSDLNLPGSGFSSSTKSLIDNNSPLVNDRDDVVAMTSPLATSEINQDEDINNNESRNHEENIDTPRSGLSQPIDASISSGGTYNGDNDIQATVKKSNATSLTNTDIGVDEGINTMESPRNLRHNFESSFVSERKAPNSEESGTPAGTERSENDEHPTSMSGNNTERSEPTTPASQQEREITTGRTPITIDSSDESDVEEEDEYDNDPIIQRKREMQRLVISIFEDFFEDYQKEIDKRIELERNFNDLKKSFEDIKDKFQTNMGGINEIQQAINDDFMRVMQSLEDNAIKP